MKTSIRSIFAISALAVVLAACSTTAAPNPESPAPAPSSPAAPSEVPSEAPTLPVVTGTISVVDGVAVGGPGVSIAEAIANPTTQPVLVNGVLYLDTDGTLFLADALTLPELRLAVLDYPFSEAEWDLANAELTGLQEANGILFFEDEQVFGVIES